MEENNKIKTLKNHEESSAEMPQYDWKKHKDDS